MTDVDTLRIATVQFEPVAGDIQANLATVDRLAREAAASGARLVVFPEMCLVGYWHLTKKSAQELRGLANARDAAPIQAVRRLAGELGVGIGVGFLESAGDELFNSYAVCLPDGAMHVHRKLHAFEHEAISSGSDYTVFDTPWGVRIGVLICYDNNINENVRISALLGAQVLLAPHQTGGTSSRSPRGMKPIPAEVWDRRHEDPKAVEEVFRGPNGRGWLMRWLPSRAHDNGMVVVFSNGVGRDDDEIRPGGSMIIDAYGEILAECWEPREAVVVADADLSEIPLSSGRRWMRGRRPELYSRLVQRTGQELGPRAARFSPDPVRSPNRGNS